MVKQIVGTEENGTTCPTTRRSEGLLGREAIDESQRNVLVSHQFYLPPHVQADQVERMESEIRTVGNIDEVSGEMLQIFDYRALGPYSQTHEGGRRNFTLLRHAPGLLGQRGGPG